MPLTSIAPWECIFVFIRELVEQKKNALPTNILTRKTRKTNIFFRPTDHKEQKRLPN